MILTIALYYIEFITFDAWIRFLEKSLRAIFSFFTKRKDEQ